MGQDGPTHSFEYRSSDSVIPFTSSFMDSVLNEAFQSQRKRKNFNFHENLSDNPNRFFNAMAKGTYVTPHRHLHPPKPESFVVLRGKIGFLIFSDEGHVENTFVLSSPDQDDANPCGIDLKPGIWHSLLVLGESALIFEVKPGPYEPSTDKDFAPWAPGEGDPDAMDYLNRMRDLFGH